VLNANSVMIMKCESMAFFRIHPRMTDENQQKYQAGKFVS
jgi:hypothetical protein